MPAWRSFARPAIIVVGLVLAAYVLSRIPLTIEVFAIATLIAYGVNPLIRVLSTRVPRPAAIALVYGGFVLALLVLAIIVIPTTVEQVQSLFANSGTYLSATEAFIDREQAWLNHRFGGHVLAPQLSKLESSLLNQMSSAVQSGVSRLGAAVVSAATAVVVGLTAILLSYYFLVNAHYIRRSFLSLFPPSGQTRAELFLQEIQRVFSGFVGGQIILCAFCGILTFIGLLIIHSQFAVLLAVVTGVLYAIPYLGVAAALLLGALLGLLQGWPTALWTVIIIFVVTRIADTFLVPKVMAESVGVSPMAIIFAVFAGGELFGLWGLVLAIPVAALCKSLWVVWGYPWLTGKDPPPEASAQGQG